MKLKERKPFTTQKWEKPSETWNIMACACFGEQADTYPVHSLL